MICSAEGLFERVGSTLRAVACLICLAIPGPALANLIVVTTEFDGPVNVDGECSLREAVTNALLDSFAGSPDCVNGSGADSISFANVYFSTPRQILLTSPLPFLSGDLEVLGPGRNKLTISGDSTYRIFFVSDGNGTPDSTVSISDMTLANGMANGSGGGAIVNLENLSINRVRFGGNSAGPSSGGAIRSQAGTLTINQSGFAGNVAPDGTNGFGGAIFADGATTQVTISASLFDGNQSEKAGGAVYSQSPDLALVGVQFLQNQSMGGVGGALAQFGAVANVDASWFDANEALSTGGAVQFNGTTLTVTRSTFSENVAASGSAIYLVGSSSATLRQSTFSANESLSGSGAVALSGATNAAISFSTFYGNLAATGGRAVHNYGIGAASLLSAVLVSGTTSTALCGGVGAVTADASTQSQNSSCSGASNAGAALFNTLTPLQNNGGSWATHAPTNGSPAIDAAPSCDGLTADQRGYPRPQDGDFNGSTLCDAGSVEYQSIVVNTTFDSLSTGNDGLCSLREAFLNAAFNDQTAPDCATGRGADTIEFNLPSSSTINLVAVLPQVSEALSIIGPGVDQLTIDATVVPVPGIPGACLAPMCFKDGDNGNDLPIIIKGLTLANGHLSAAGFVYSTEALVVDQVAFIGNSSSDNNSGGAVSQIDGSLTITQSRFVGNQATGAPAAGAVFAQGTAFIDVSTSTFDQNHADSVGGAVTLFGAGEVSLQGNTLSGNTASNFGGAVYLQGDTDITAENLTVSGNSAGIGGGGFYVSGSNASLNAHNLTFVGNQANNGLSLRVANASSALIADSILHDGGVGGSHCDAAGATSFALTGTNLVDDGSCAGVAATGSAALRIDTQLRDNGGSTATHAILQGSPAIDAATECAGIPTDQRGVARGIDGDNDGLAGCDVGAYELQPIVVDTASDVLDNADGLCSLREALVNANLDRRNYRSCAGGKGADLILFNLPNPSTITLSSALPTVATPMTIQGPGKAKLTIDANQQARHFLVNDGDGGGQSTVVISDMTLTNGLAGAGGSIRSFESLSLDLIDFLNNTANADGGGALMVEQGGVNSSRLYFSGNAANNGAGGDGGAVFVRGGASFSLNQAGFNGNTAAGFGGAMNFQDAAASSVLRVGFRSNQSGQAGGALSVRGTTTLDATNLTFSENQSGTFGGGLAVISGTATVRHATFFQNLAASGGSSVRVVSGATATLSDSLLVRDGVGSVHCSVSGSTLTMAGASLVDDASCPGVSQTATTDIGLDPTFGFNFGFSGTHALLADSAAIDAGLDCASLPSDQRGISRPQDGDLDGSAVCDIGAVELRPIIVDTVDDVTDNGDGLCSLREAMTNANSDTKQWSSCVSGSGPDLIGFNLPSPATIVLSGVLPQITTAMTIRGPGRDALTIDANAAGRHFIVNNADPSSFVDVSLSGMTLINALAAGAGGSLVSLENLVLSDMRFSNNEATVNPAGAVSVNEGSAQISDSEFINNAASNASNGRGGALRVAVNASASLTNSQFQGNDAATYGGAIAVDGGGALTGSGLLFSGNHADADGGALDLDGASATGDISATRFTGNTSVAFGGGVSVREGADLSLHRVTLDANHTDGVGGGASVRLNSTLDAENSTFSGNTAGNQGGGLYAGAPLTLVALTGSTFFGNDAANLGEALRSSQATIGLVNSLLEDNDVAGDLCSGANGASITANAGTIADDASCTGATAGSSLNLGPLTDYGFIAPSHGLLPWSDAVDATVDCAGLVIDQRGESRPSGAGCDAGSFEVHNIAPQTKGEMFISGETQNVAGLNLLANELDPDNTGTMEVERVGYTDVNGQPQILNISGVHLNPFTIQPGVVVYVGRNGELAFSPGSALLYLTPGSTLDLGVNYVVSDGYSEAGASFTLRFNGEETPPVLANDTKTVAMDSAGTTIDVLANDTDVDGGTNTITAVTQPANGTVVIAGDSLSLTYQPNATYCNDGMPTDDFTYTVNGSLTANVAVTVSCGPVGIDLSVGISGDTVAAPGSAVGYQVLAQNIGDVDGTASINVLFDARLSGVSWTCTLTPGGACASGAGDISTEIALTAGTQVQFDVTATTPAAASNTPLSVSAAVDAVGDTDVDTGNNVANFETETALFLDGFEGTVP